jgi:hypothetical protein
MKLEKETKDRLKLIEKQRQADKNKRGAIYAAPQGMINPQGVESNRLDDFKFFPTAKNEPTLEFKTSLFQGDEANTVPDFDGEEIAPTPNTGPNTLAPPMSNETLSGTTMNATLIQGAMTIAPSKIKEENKDQEINSVTTLEVAKAKDYFDETQKEVDDRGNRF